MRDCLRKQRPSLGELVKITGRIFHKKRAGLCRRGYSEKSNDNFKERQSQTDGIQAELLNIGQEICSKDLPVVSRNIWIDLLFR